MRVEDEARPGYVDAIAKGTARVCIDRNPFLVVNSRRCGRRVYERRLAPRQVAAAVESPLIHRYSVGRSSAVESQARIIDVALAIESHCRIAAGVVGSTSKMFDTRYQRAQT
jgi:hypothetical protein